MSAEQSRVTFARLYCPSVTKGDLEYVADLKYLDSKGEGSNFDLSVLELLASYLGYLKARQGAASTEARGGRRRTQHGPASLPRPNETAPGNDPPPDEY